ncbi:MAG: alpha/beta fold hydrolase [Rhodoluna sp.]|nr:alpha/beta fold hydrolase [Rhodoluna sp.]
MKLKLAFVATLAALTLVLAGCATPSPEESLPPITAPTAVATPEVKDELKSFYTQKVEWESCGTRIQCGSVLVPTNWGDPSAGSLSLAVAYRAADIAKPLGSIIFNPGGPGSSGYDWILNSVDYLGTKNLRSKFNIVGFDPRGVGESEPRVKCFDAKKTDQMLYEDNGFPLGSPQDLAASRKLLGEFAKACLKNTGPAMAFLDTVSAAKDMDVLRAVMGESQLDYLGFSYGSLLGQTYAALFPKNVNRMVIDGVIDPTVSDAEQSVIQLKGFDLALRNYLADCLSSADCPFRGTVSQALTKIKTLLRSLETNPIPGQGGRQLNAWSANTGLIMPLYSEDYWPQLSQAFAEAFDGDGTTFLELADTYNDRDSSGKYLTNLMEANIAISCLDARQPSDSASMAKQNARMLAASPTLGRYWQFGALTCEPWPFPVAAHPSDFSANGSKPILVIGTTGDPATPYSQAVAVANHILSNGHLVTYNGEGHTAYGRSNECVANSVDNYFIKGLVPAADPNC